MLSLVRYEQDPYSLGDFAGGYPEVQELQQALRDLSTAAKFPAGDPGAIDGIVRPKTLQAIAAWAARIPRIPSAVRTLIPIATAAFEYLPTSVQQDALATVQRHAREITVGVKLLLTQYKRGPAQAPTGAPGAPETYPTGTITAFSAKRGVWRIAVPIGLAGLAQATHQEIAPAAQAPAGVPQVQESKLEAQTGQAAPIYTKPWFWAAVGGGVLVLGGGAYLLLRKPRPV